MKHQADSYDKVREYSPRSCRQTSDVTHVVAAGRVPGVVAVHPGQGRRQRQVHVVYGVRDDDVIVPGDDERHKTGREPSTCSRRSRGSASHQSGTQAARHDYCEANRQQAGGHATSG